MVKKTRHILDRLSLISGYPTEALPGVTLIELAGNSRVLIENHKGVAVYRSSEIHIKTGYGSVCVSGANLELARMTREQLVITGMISALALFNEVD